MERGKPDYPVQPGFTEDPCWKAIHLYTIAGWFSNVYEDHRGGRRLLRQATAFSGRFRLDPSDGSLEGLLHDQWGLSVIEGYLENKLLTFDKYYIDPSHRPPIEYKFIESKNGAWKGKYIASDLGRHNKGRAESVLMLVNNNAYGIIDGVYRGGSVSHMLGEAKRRLA